MPWISSNSLQRETYSLSLKSLIKLHVVFFMTSSSLNAQISHPHGCQSQAIQVFKNDALKYCAARVAGHSGDVRKARHGQRRTWGTGQKHLKMYNVWRVSVCSSVCVSSDIHFCLIWMVLIPSSGFSPLWIKYRCVSYCVVWPLNSNEALQLCRRALELCCERSRTSEILALWLRLDCQPWEP